MPSSQLNCPNCGAPAAPDAAQCAYCRSALATVTCPACFGAMFAGTQFCPHCGVRTERGAADASASTLKCPGCGTEMPGVRIGDTPMHQCPSCAGTWLDTETFTALCTNREERGSVANLIGGGAAPPGPRAPLAAVHYMPCPQCRKTMNRTNFGHRSGVILDVCKGHGAWFEAGELRNVLVFVESGGLEKARAEDMQRQIEEKTQLDRAAALTFSRGT